MVSVFLEHDILASSRKSLCVADIINGFDDVGGTCGITLE
jgi:hypothetical protein